ncbi:MAG: xanthine dehydrogenase family protein molybdopterin-binding subunit [bacterium]
MMEYIGKSIQKVDAVKKVTGEALYPGDFTYPDQLHMKILFARRTSARVVSIDTSRAEKLNGVVAVLTAKDVPVNIYGMIVKDQPVLCGPGSDVPFADRVRFVGDQVALVVAETEQIASKAAELIDVVYEDLPVVSSHLQAMEEGSFLVHPDKESNVFCHFRIRKGEIDKAFADADVIIEGEYTTPVQEHAYLQPEAGVSFIDEEGRVTVVVSGQCAHEDQEQIAHALGISHEMVRVVYPAIGGAFGGREDVSIQIALALATFRLHERGIDRPVKIIWSREESIIGHHKRHAYTIRTKWGAMKDGKVIAARAEVIADGGAYIYTSTKVLGNATLMCTGPYMIQNVSVDSYAVYTNNVPGGAFRGFGGPQGAFAAESQMNRLAEVLGMDPVEIRLKNVLREGDLLSVGTPLPKGVSLDKVIEQCALKAGWKLIEGKWQMPEVDHAPDTDRPFVKRGLGFSCAFKNVGFSFGAPEHCDAKITLEGKAEIEKAILYHAAADVGQGIHTAMAQMAAEALGLPLEKIELILSDTATSLFAGSASASRLTFMAGNSIKGAAALALEKWNNEERPATAEFVYRPPKTTMYDPDTGKSEPNFAYGYVAEAVEVDIDTETGQVNVNNVICADDVGQAVNPLIVQGQIEGAVVQAAGYAILENYIQENGVPKTTKLSTYLIPTVLDIPKNVESIILEFEDPIGPWGARGMGEMPYLPFTAAIVDGIHNATGVWFDEYPLTAERVLDGIGGLD